MSESQFHEQADHIYLLIEDQIDDLGVDLDYEISGGVMTITCELDDSKVILSRQSATAEIWVAARSGGFHFREENGSWHCATGEELAELLSRVLSEQTKESVVVALR